MTDATTLQRAASDNGVHVGIVTLETDLAPLLADEMVASMKELELSAPLNTKFQAAIREAQQQDPSKTQKDEILRRINSVGKGRFAQRLAAHIDTTSHEVLRRVADAAISQEDERHDNPTDEVVDKTAPRPYDWLTVARYGYILAALDQMSHVVRNHGLLEEPAPASNVQDLRPSNGNE